MFLIFTFIGKLTILNIIYLRIFILGLGGGHEAGNVCFADLVNSHIPFGKHISRTILRKMTFLVALIANIVLISFSSLLKLVKLAKLSKGVYFLN